MSPAHIIHLYHVLKMQQNNRQAVAIVLTQLCIEKPQESRRGKADLATEKYAFLFLNFVEKWNL